MVPAEFCNWHPICNCEVYIKASESSIMLVCQAL